MSEPRIEVVEVDITTLEVDAIANASNTRLSKFIAAAQRGRELLAGREEPAEVG